MAKAEQTKGSTVKRLIPIIIAAAVLVGLAFSVKKFLAEKEKGEAQRLERQAEEKAKEEAEAVGKLYGKPVSTVADTDDVRRYGYDVLLARHGVRVMLKESKIYADTPQITFEMINESDEDFTIKLVYCVINGLTCKPSLETNIPAGKTVTDTVDFDYDKIAEIKINKLRMCFKIMNEDFSIYEDSKAIRVNYDNSDKTNAWIPPDSAEPVYESSTLTISDDGFSLEDSDDGGKIAYSELYYNNDTSHDLLFYMNSCQLFNKKGSEISSDHYYVTYRDMAPGNSCTYTADSIVFWIDDTIDPDDLGELLLIANTSPRDEEDGDTETITMNIPLKFQ